MRKLYTNLFGLFAVAILAVAGFNSAEADSPKMVVVEQFTSTTCPPCATANPPFHAGLAERSDFVIPLVHHVWYPSPGDPMYEHDRQMNENRHNYYGVSGIPAATINGGATTNAGTIVNQNFSPIDAQKGQTSPVDISIVQNGDDVAVTVKTSTSLQSHVLRVAVLEYEINYTSAPGSNGEMHFPWVPRQMLPDSEGTDVMLSPGGEQTYNLTINRRDEWEDSQIYVVAFVQNTNTKEVLQGATNIEPKPIRGNLNNTLVKAQDGTTVPFSASFTNENDFEVSGPVMVSSTSKIPEGWEVELDKSEITLAAGGSATVSGTVTIPKDKGGYAEALIALDMSAPGKKKIILAGLSPFGVLSSATKNVYYTGYHTSPRDVEEALDLAGFKDDYFSIAISQANITQFPPIDFEIIIVVFNLNNYGRLVNSNMLGVLRGVLQ